MNATARADGAQGRIESVAISYLKYAARPHSAAPPDHLAREALRRFPYFWSRRKREMSQLPLPTGTPAPSKVVLLSVSYRPT